MCMFYGKKETEESPGNAALIAQVIIQCSSGLFKWTFSSKLLSILDIVVPDELQQLC
jgi:hypothetical protein